MRVSCWIVMKLLMSSQTGNVLPSGKKIILIIYAILLFTILLVVYGLVPGRNIWSLGTSYVMLANTQAQVNQGFLDWSYLKNMGYPLGYPLLCGAPFVYLSSFFSALVSLDTYLANTYTAILFLFLSFIVFAKLLRWLGCGTAVSITFSFVFFIQHFLYGQSGYHYLLYGFILLPSYIYADIKFISYLELNNEIIFSKKIIILYWLVLFVFIKTFAVFTDGYSFLISVLFSMVLPVVYTYKVKTIRRNVIIYCIVVFLSCAVSITLYKMYVPGHAIYKVMPTDFFRSQGVDIISFFCPGKDLFLFNSLGIWKKWNGLAFYGDGCNVKYSYLGYSLLVLFLAFLFKRAKPFPVSALIFSGTIALILSLGPSLKVNDYKEVAEKDLVTFQDYLMPRNAATLNLHTDLFYQRIPGLNNMRVVSRWLLLFKLTLVVCAALMIDGLCRTGRKKLAIFITFLIFCELFPNIKNLYAIHSSFLSTIEMFDTDVLHPLKQYVHPQDKILFLSSDNDFLANYLAAKLDARSYNAGGDKNFEIARHDWPDPVRNILQDRDVKHSLCLAMDNGLIDVFIIPYFNLRWHSYRWPPRPDEKVWLKESRLSQLPECDRQLFIHEDRWFAVVSLKSISWGTISHEVMSNNDQ